MKHTLRFPSTSEIVQKWQNRNPNPQHQNEYTFKEVEGEGVYQIPVGPVHAGIIEPGHFRFSVIGETIFNLEVRLFYKHRGLEKLAEGIKPQECVKIAETISGDETVANAVAYCIAVEKICDVDCAETGFAVTNDAFGA